MFPDQENNKKRIRSHLHEMELVQAVMRTFWCACGVRNGMVCISSYRISDSTDWQNVINKMLGSITFPTIYGSLRSNTHCYGCCLGRLLRSATCTDIFNPHEMFHFCLHATCLDFSNPSWLMNPFRQLRDPPIVLRIYARYLRSLHKLHDIWNKYTKMKHFVTD